MANYIDDIKKGLQSWVSRELKITVIFAEQFEIRPEATPYATIRLGPINHYGFMDESDEVNDNGNANVDGHRSAMVRVDLNGTGAIEKALQLQASLSKTTVLGILWNSYGISVIDRGNVINISELLETKGIERAVLDVSIGFAVQFVDEQGLIEHVELTSEYNGETISTDVIPPIEE